MDKWCKFCNENKLLEELAWQQASCLSIVNRSIKFGDRQLITLVFNNWKQISTFNHQKNEVSNYCGSATDLY